MEVAFADPMDRKTDVAKNKIGFGVEKELGYNEIKKLKNRRCLYERAF